MCHDGEPLDFHPRQVHDIYVNRSESPVVGTCGGCHKPGMVESRHHKQVHCLQDGASTSSPLTLGIDGVLRRKNHLAMAELSARVLSACEAAGKLAHRQGRCRLDNPLCERQDPKVVSLLRECDRLELAEAWWRGWDAAELAMSRAASDLPAAS